MAYLDDNGLLYLWNKIKMLLANKVDKVSGKQLSTNDYTTVEKNKLSGIADNATRVIVEQDIVNQSSNPLAGKVVQEMLGNVTNGIQQLADNKVDKETGKGLSTNDYTTVEKTKLADLNNFVHPTTDGNKHVPATGTTNNGKALIAGSTAGAFSWQTLTKSMVGLGSVDNTSDVNKPLSTATRNALNEKMNFYNRNESSVNLSTLLEPGYHQFKSGCSVTGSPVASPLTKDLTVLIKKVGEYTRDNVVYNLVTQEAVIFDDFHKCEIYFRKNGPTSGSATLESSWIGWVRSYCMSESEKSKLTELYNYVHPSTHPATMITQDATHRFVTDTEKNTWNAKASTAVATTTANGLMAAEDKTKLNGIATGATKVIVEQSLVNQSSNPLAGKVVQTMIGNVMDGVTELGNQLDGKVDKVTGKGLSTNDYTTTEKNKLAAFGAASTYALKADIVGMYKYKGSVADASKLPTTGQTTGDVYNIVAPSIYGAAGANVAWDGSKWDSLGEIFTITSITNAQIDTICA